TNSQSVHRAAHDRLGAENWNRLLAQWEGTAHAQAQRPIQVGAFLTGDLARFASFGVDARNEGAPAVALLLDRDAVWIVPMMSPHGAGCAECLVLWLRNNHPERDSWE